MYGGPLHNATFVKKILGYLPTLEKDTYGTLDRIKGVLSTILEETSIDQPGKTQDPSSTKAGTTVGHSGPARVAQSPFYINPSNLASVVRSRCPSDAQIKGAIRHAGFKAARSHTKPSAIRTTAPWEFLWEMMRQWVQQHAPIKSNALKSTTAGYKIMYEDISEKAGSSSSTGSKNDHATPQEDGTDNSGKKIRKLGNWEMTFDEKLGQDASTERLVRFQLNPEANWGPMHRAKG